MNRIRTCAVPLVSLVAVVCAASPVFGDESFSSYIQTSRGGLTVAAASFTDPSTARFSHIDSTTTLDGASDAFAVHAEWTSVWTKKRFRIVVDFDQYGTVTFVADGAGRLFFIESSTVPDCVALESSDTYQAIL